MLENKGGGSTSRSVPAALALGPGETQAAEGTGWPPASAGPGVPLFPFTETCLEQDVGPLAVHGW